MKLIRKKIFLVSKEKKINVLFNFKISEICAKIIVLLLFKMF